jgi:LAO/AO transport system ATPase
MPSTRPSLPPPPHALHADLLAGDRRAVARAMSLIERGAAGAADLRAAIAPQLGRAHVLGITGAPGAGKSTLVDALLGALLARGERVGVVAVDPSSPISGGALLGDRVRMDAHGEHPNVFIRSLASRGQLGGLSQATRGVVDVLDAAGFDTVIVETVGAGQSEVEVTRLADTCLVACPPGLGDDVQAIKAGILEIADLFVVTKADLPGARATARDLQQMLRVRAVAADAARPTEPGWQVAVVPVAASLGDGLDALIEKIDAHAQSAGRGRRLHAAHAGAGVEPMPRHGLQAARIGACSTWPGIEQVSDAEGHAIASLQLRAAHLDAEGRCERSVVFALADAAWTLAAKGRGLAPVAGVDLNIALDRMQHEGETLLARAAPASAPAPPGPAAAHRVEVFGGDGEAIARVAFRLAST